MIILSNIGSNGHGITKVFDWTNDWFAFVNASFKYRNGADFVPETGVNQRRIVITNWSAERNVRTTKAQQKPLGLRDENSLWRNVLSPIVLRESHTPVPSSFGRHLCLISVMVPITSIFSSDIPEEVIPSQHWRAV